jgi:hypothetical protein
LPEETACAACPYVNVDRQARVLRERLRGGFRHLNMRAYGL